MGSPVGNTYKLIFLGAPSNSALTGTRISDLSNEEHPAFSQLFSTKSKPSSQRPASQSKPPRSTQQPSWRTLSLNRPTVGQKFASTTSRASHSQLSTQQESASASQSFFGNSLGTEYLEASFVAFQSQPAEDESKNVDSACGIESYNKDDVSYDTTQDEPSDTTVIVAAFPHLPANLKIVKLKTVPTARQLTALQPQTVSISTIAAIIAIEPPRLITTRYGNPMMISNIIIGDETRTGFGITVWLPPDETNDVDEKGRRRKPPTEAAKRLKANVLSLRPQDVVVVTNLALTSFKDNVYGSSMGRDRTSLHILYRLRKLERADDRFRPNLEEICNQKDPRFHHAVETRKVAAWARDFVAWDWEKEVKNKDATQTEDSWMPEDTLLEKSY